MPTRNGSPSVPFEQDIGERHGRSARGLPVREARLIRLGDAVQLGELCTSGGEIGMLNRGIHVVLGSRRICQLQLVFGPLQVRHRIQTYVDIHFGRLHFEACALQRLTRRARRHARRQTQRHRDR